MSQHVLEDEPYGISNQSQPVQTQQGRNCVSQEQPNSSTGSAEHVYLAEQCHSPAGVTQHFRSEEQGMAGGSEQGQQSGAGGAPQLALQLQGAACQGHGAPADTMALQHGYHSQTHAEIRQSPETNHKHESQLPSHLQLSEQPMSHVQQTLSRMLESCQGPRTERAHGPGSGEEQEEEEQGGVVRGSFMRAASPNAAKFAYAR